MFSQWATHASAAILGVCRQFPSDGATRVATTKNGHALPLPTTHSRAWRNEQCTPYERFSSCTSHEVDEIECFIDKNNCSTCGAPLRTTELTFPEHHLNEVMHTATDGRNGLFAPLLSRLRFAAIRGDLLISDTLLGLGPGYFSE